MRKILVALFATLFLMSGSATMVATAGEATPETGSDKASESNPVDPEVGDTVTYFTEDGEAAGTITVESVERGWEEYDEFYEPEEGTEYVAFVVTVESTIERGGIDVESYDFSLQTASGGYWGTAFASSETADPPLLEDDISLANGDSETFTLVYQVYEGETLAHLFWSPDSGVLLTAAQLEDE